VPERSRRRRFTILSEDGALRAGTDGLKFLSRAV
jgi:hypothetical protein